MISAFDVTGIGAVVYKEVRHILREPTSLALIIAMPVLQMLIYGYAIDLHVQHVASVYYSGDNGRVATELERALGRSTAFRIVGRVASPAAVQRELVAGRARVAFEIPAGFSRDVETGRAATVQMLVDGSDANVAQAAYGGASRIENRIAQMSNPFGEAPAVDIRTRTLFNPSLRTPNFLIPGLIGLMLQNITMVLTALSVVNERDRGTLEQMRATPIGAGAMVLGKVLPYGVIGFIDLLLVLLAMRVLFAVPVAGSVVMLLALSAVFLVTGLGLGLLISTLARSQLQAMIMTIFFLLPSFLLSGMFFEIDLMPIPAQVIAYALPMTYFLELLRGIIIRGAGIGDLWLPAVVTVAFAIGAMTLASMRFAARV